MSALDKRPKLVETSSTLETRKPKKTPLGFKHFASVRERSFNYKMILVPMGDVLAAKRQLYPYKVRLSSLKLVPIKKLQSAHSLHSPTSLKMILKISSNLNYRKHKLQLQSILSCLQRKTIRLTMVLPTMMKHLYLFHASYHRYITTTQHEKKNQ